MKWIIGIVLIIVLLSICMRYRMNHCIDELGSDDKFSSESALLAVISTFAILWILAKTGLET